MASFHYRAVTAAGQSQQGVREGASEKAVVGDLQSLGLVPVYVGLSPEGNTAGGQNWLAMLLGANPDVLSRQGVWHGLAGRRVTGRDRLLFTQELATLLNAGPGPLDLFRADRK